MNPPITPEELLAERRYRLECQGRTTEILVQVAIPRMRQEDGRWICRAVVVEGESVSSKPMNGADAFEALQLALNVVGVELWSIVDESKGTISWLDGQMTGLGMPSFDD